MKLHVVTHCWGRHLELNAHLAGILNGRPRSRHEVRVTVWHGISDDATRATLRYWQEQCDGQRRLQLTGEVAADEFVCNRAAGRNHSALRTEADWVWFADARMIPGPHFLSRACDALAAMEPGVKLAIPRRVQTCSVTDAKALPEKLRTSRIEDHKDRFEDTRCCKPRGGFLFVPGPLCQRIGYLNDTPAAREPSASLTWVEPWADAVFVERLNTIPRVFIARWLYMIGCF